MSTLSDSKMRSLKDKHLDSEAKREEEKGAPEAKVELKEKAKKAI